MDIEKEIGLSYNDDLIITVPAKTKSNIENGHYISSNYEKSTFRRLMNSPNVVRYKRYIVCNRYIYDLKNEELIAFCSLSDWSREHDYSAIYYNSRYNLSVKVSTVLWNYLEYEYYSANPRTKLQKTLFHELTKLGFDKQKLINSVNLTIQQLTEVV
jgi:hypothetical protein